MTETPQQPEWPVTDPDYTYHHLPEYDLCLAYADGEAWDITAPKAWQQMEALMRRRGEGMYTPLRAMLTEEAREQYLSTLAEAQNDES